MDFARVFQKLDTGHKASRHPGSPEPLYDRGISNERAIPATHRDWAWAYLWIVLALAAYAGIAWGMGWLP